MSAWHCAVQWCVCVYGLHVSDQGSGQCLQQPGVRLPCRLVDESQSQHYVADGGEFLCIKCDVLGYWNPATTGQLRVLHCEYGLQLATCGVSVFRAFSGNRAQSDGSSAALRLCAAWNGDRYPPVPAAHVLQFLRGSVREYDGAALSLAFCETKCFIFSFEDRSRRNAERDHDAARTPGAEFLHDGKAYRSHQLR